jgi:hypothetical protein
LRIDDPITWFNAVPPELVDFWVAVYTVNREDPSKPKRDPSVVFDEIFEGM